MTRTRFCIGGRATQGRLGARTKCSLGSVVPLLVMIPMLTPANENTVMGTRFEKQVDGTLVSPV